MHTVTANQGALCNKLCLQLLMIQDNSVYIRYLKQENNTFRSFCLAEVGELRI
jgi:hypothetical protein